MVVVGLQDGTFTTVTYDATGLRRKSQAGAAMGDRGRAALALGCALALVAGCRLGGATGRTGWWWRTGAGDPSRKGRAQDDIQRQQTKAATTGSSRRYAGRAG
jgi:hypothetical protein